MAHALCVGASAALAACSTPAPTDTEATEADPLLTRSGQPVAVCHMNGRHGGMVREVARHAVAAHLAHGDYLTTLFVSHAPGQPESDQYFRRIGDALATARSGRLARGELREAACRITISVSSGTFEGTTAGEASGDIEHFPLIVDVPDITLRGALVMALDRDGRATGDGQGEGKTTLAPVEPLPVVSGSSTPLVAVNAHPGGSAGDGFWMSGFVLQSGHDPAVGAGGQGVFSLRAQGLRLRGNRFEQGFTESIDLRGGSGDVAQNHLAGGAGTCDICLAGPGRYRASGNRLLAGGIPGILIFAATLLPVPQGVEQFELPASAEVWADVWNNEVRDHVRTPVGTGIRVGAVGIGAPNVQGKAHALIRDNLLVNNRFGMIVEAGFPVAGSTLKGDVDVVFSRNVIQESCQAKLLVSLSRHTTALGLSNLPYLVNSTYRLVLHGGLAWDDAWYSNPSGFGNALVVNGEAVDYGSRQSYDAVGCPGL